jgi:galactokinase
VSDVEQPDRLELARLCSRVENEWVGAETGLLDQIASLFGAPHEALRIDFRTLELRPVPLRLGDWALVIVDSGERHSNASGGYNERRRECAAAAERLGVELLSEADREAAAGLPDPLDRRALHVLDENARVDAAVEALASDDVPALAALIDSSHASLRDQYEASTPAVEATVRRLTDGGAAGARMMGGGFGGHVLALFPPGMEPPADARHVAPGAGARVVERG